MSAKTDFSTEYYEALAGNKITMETDKGAIELHPIRSRDGTCGVQCTGPGALSVFIDTTPSLYEEDWDVQGVKYLHDLSLAREQLGLSVEQESLLRVIGCATRDFSLLSADELQNRLDGSKSQAEKKAEAVSTRFRIEASRTDPRTRSGFERDNIHDYGIATTHRTMEAEAQDYLKSGYWVEIYNDTTDVLLGGPHAPGRVPEKLLSKTDTAAASGPFIKTYGDTTPAKDPKNGLRVENAQAAINAFMGKTGVDFEDALGDILTDLKHWADHNGQDFSAALAQANNHHEEEITPKAITVPSQDDLKAALAIMQPGLSPSGSKFGR